jgi:N-acetylmuramoyl-L-alanine amidase
LRFPYNGHYEQNAREKNDNHVYTGKRSGSIFEIQHANSCKATSLDFRPMDKHRNRKLMSKSKLLAFAVLSVAFIFLAAGYRSDKSYKRPFTVVIDAGHGGIDPGNLGTGRFKSTEKDVTLDVSLKLGAYIEEKIPGTQIIYTRKGDSFPTLKDRVETANNNQADLFISIHCNAAASQAYGSETFVMGMHKTEESLKNAMRENASIYLEENYEQNYAGFDPKDPETYIIMSLRQNVFLDQSLTLSKYIQDQFRERLGRKDRGVKQAGYYVISFTTMPSVLVELGFLTNPKEEDFLNSAEGRDYMASAIFRAFRQYKEEIDNKNGEISSGETTDSPKTSSSQEVKSVQVEKIEEQNDGLLYDDIGDGLRYEVQIAASEKKLQKIPANFKGLTKVQEYLSGKMYRYTAGKTSDYNRAKTNLDKLINLGFKDAFIVAYEGGERIDLKKARQMENRKK